jgi:hypothetical protein
MQQFIHNNLPLLLGCGVGFMLALGVWVFSTLRQQEKSDNRDADETIAEIIGQSRDEHRLRFVDDTTVEFVYLILGDGEGLHMIWARINIGMISKYATICYMPGLALRYRDYAHALVDAFKRQGWPATMEQCAEQPQDHELGVREENTD